MSPSTSITRVRSPRWTSLLYFTTRKHLIFLMPAILFAIAAGAILPVNAFLFGKIFENFSKFGMGELGAPEFRKEVTTYNMYLVVVGSGNWLLVSLAFISWESFGGLQARSAREKLFRVLIDRDIEWFDQKKDGMGAFTDRVLTHVQELQAATSQPLCLGLQCISTAVCAFGLAFYISWKLAFVIIAALPVLAATAPVFSSRIQTNIDEQTSRMSIASKHVTTALSSIETVKCFNGQNAEVWMYDYDLRSAAQAHCHQIFWNALQAGLFRLASLGMFVQGFWYGSVLVDKGEKTAGEILSAFWASILGTGALMQLMPYIMPLEKGRSAGARLRLTSAQEMRQRNETDAGLGQVPENCAGDIMFRKVSFSYPSRPSQLALDEISLFFSAGETTFIIGKSGSGKSTVGQLLVRYYDPSRGDITLDSTPIRGLDVTWLRQNILLVEQQSILFNDTILENLSLGRPPSKDLSDHIRATQFSEIRSTIDEMPDGFMTVVGAKGGTLSGGQRQRVALARAWLRNPPVLILDESTSALDKANRVLVMEAIRKWRKGKTTIIITHDISQIAKDDFVYVISDGRVVQDGYRHALKAVDGSPFTALLSTAHETSETQNNSDLDEDLMMTSWGQSDLPFPTEERRPSHGASNLNLFGTMKVAAERRNSQDPWDGFTEQSRLRTIRIPPILAPFAQHIHSPATPDRIEVTQELSSVRESLQIKPPVPRKSMRQSVHAKMKGTLLWVQKSSGLMQERGHGYHSRGTIWQRRQRKNAPDLLKSWRTRDIIKTIWPNMTWQQRILLVGALTATAVFGAATPMFAFVFSKLLSTLFVPEGRQAKAMLYSVAVLAVAVVDSVAVFFMESGLARAGQLWANNIRTKAWTAILDQPRTFFDEEENAVSRLVECLDHHGEEMQHILAKFLGNVLIVVVMLSVAFVWATIRCWKLTLVVIACIPALYMIFAILKAVSGEMDRRVADANTTCGTIFTECLVNIKTVKSLTAETHFRNKHLTASSRALNHSIQRAMSCGVIFGLSQSGLMYITALVFHYGARLVASGEFELEPVVQVFVLLLLSTSTATMILSSIPQMSVSCEAAARLLRLFDLSRQSYEHEGTAHIPSIGDITLHNLTFCYPTRSGQEVLKDVSLNIPAGTCISMVGRSGSGKSTIANLLLNLYPLDTSFTRNSTHDIGAQVPPSPYYPPSISTLSPTPTTPTIATPLRPPQSLNLNPNQPDILFSGRSIRRVHTPTLRRLIAVVPQTPHLFPASIAANITYGLHPSSPHNTPAAVREAAKCAGAHDFIASLPEGYDTVVGEGGTGLSGGQVQRIAIARALVREPDVLILDEATNALDAGAAARLGETVRRLVAGRNAPAESRGRKLTVIIITHAQEMMRFADWVVVLEKGRLVECGTYDRLMRRRNGKLRELMMVGAED